MVERRARWAEIGFSIASLGILCFALTTAFSTPVRKEIGQRDRWTCMDCGKKFSDGWMVHAAHLSEHHHKSDPLYDDPESGIILCVECHLKQHQEGTSLGDKDQYAIMKLENTDRRTYKWRNSHT